MALPITIENPKGVNSWSRFAAGAAGIVAAATPFVVLNTDAKTAQATYFNDPYKLAAGNDANGGAVRRFSVPPGTPYLFLSHAYIVGSGSHPTTPPIVRAYGLSKLLAADFADLRENVVGGGFVAPDDAWIHLGNDNLGTYDLTLGPAGEAPMRVDGAQYVTYPIPVHCAGAAEVLVAVRTPTEGPQFSCVVGSFRR